MTKYASAMEGILGILFLVALVLALRALPGLFEEYSGAIGRWRRGEPLRASVLERQRRFAKEVEAERREKAETLAAYELNPYRILDERFHRRFKALRLHEQVRQEVIEKQGMTCSCCGRQIKRLSTLHVDHIKPRKNHPHLAYVASNLQVLCSKCNRHKHDYDGDDWKDVVASRVKAKRARKARASKRSAGGK